MGHSAREVREGVDMEEWQVAIIEMRGDLRAVLRDSSRFKERLILVLLGSVLVLAGVQQFAGAL